MEQVTSVCSEGLSVRKPLGERVQCSSVILTEGQRSGGVHLPTAISHCQGCSWECEASTLTSSLPRGPSGQHLRYLQLKVFRFVCMGAGSARGLLVGHLQWASSIPSVNYVCVLRVGGTRTKDRELLTVWQKG